MKKRSFVSGLMTIAITLSLLGLPAMAAEVSQGKCVGFDKSSNQITIESFDIQISKQFPYGQPTGEKEVFDVSKAIIGIPPEPGDILRLAWESKNNAKSAMRVMNVSKQDLMKK